MIVVVGGPGLMPTLVMTSPLAGEFIVRFATWVVGAAVGGGGAVVTCA